MNARQCWLQAKTHRSGVRPPIGAGVGVFARDVRANVAMIFAVMALPLVFVVGMAIDYGTAARLNSKLNAAADAAALAAVTPAMMTQSDAASVTAAKNMFNAHAAGLPRLIYDPKDLKVTVAYVGLARNVTVAYQAQSRNAFGGILNMKTIAFGGGATGSAATPPNIDFYLLLDTSPSMAIAGTPADIQKMVGATQAQGGCAFACHQANTNVADNAGNPKDASTGQLIDNYALARRLGVTLRADLMYSAVTDLANTAYDAAHNQNAAVKPIYRMAIHSFDVAFNQLAPLNSNFVSAWATRLAAIKASTSPILEVYDNNSACAPTTTKVKGVTTTNPCGAGVGNSDADTDYDKAMGAISALMPVPGTGTNKAGDTPQEILFLVTDGVEDELVGGARHLSTMTGAKDWCTPLKTKGVKIAVLYTEYMPLPTNSFYVANIQPFQPSIATTLRNCASSGLFYQVGMGQNISAALTTLFRTAVASAHLTQ